MSTTFNKTEWIWRDGEFVRWQDATVHILATAVQFGSSVFEGIRCYDTAAGPAIFRLAETPEAASQLRAHLPHGERLQRRGADPGLLRPGTAQRAAPLLHPAGDHARLRRDRDGWHRQPDRDLDFPHGSGEPISVPTRWSGEFDVCVSSWSRAAPNTFPGMAKATGHYNNAQLIQAGGDGQRLR